MVLIDTALVVRVSWIYVPSPVVPPVTVSLVTAPAPGVAVA